MYLGVDGGGTKTAFAVMNKDGVLVSQCVLGTCHYLQVGFDGLEHVLRQGIGQVARQADISSADLTFAFLGLPGYGEDRQAERCMDRIVRRILLHGRFRCGNDAEAAWAGCLACKPGISIVAGTGTIGYGRDYAGRTARSGGWGEFCGDEGSAYWLGKQALSLFAKQADGRVDRASLYFHMRKQLQLISDFDLLSVVYCQLKDDRTSVARLARVVYEAAKEGDPHARELYEKAAYEISLIVRAIRRQLAFPPQVAVPVSYSGGVFAAGELILAPLQECLKDMSVVLVEPALPPVLGAVLWAAVQDSEGKDRRGWTRRLQRQIGSTAV